MNSLKYAKFSPEELEKELKTDLIKGLNLDQILTKRADFGLNKLPDSPTLWLNIYLRQWTSPFVFLLLIVAFLSLLTSDYINVLIILIILLINTTIGFFQEYKAEQTLNLLKIDIGHRIITVIRNGNLEIIPSEELVPGDIVSLKPGDFVPADIRILSPDSVGVDESILTGETKVVFKTNHLQQVEPKNIYQANNLLFTGTYIISGKCKGVIINIGQNTIAGNINILAKNIVHESNFQKKVAQLGNYILIIVILTVIILFFIQLFFKSGKINFYDLLMFSITLAINTVPIALPIVTVYAMTQGVLAMAKHHVLIKRLSAIEDLGGITILCTDKTGTLTQNKLDVNNIYNFNDFDALFFAYLASPLEKKDIEPINTAVIKAFQKNNNLDFELLLEIPFDAARGRNSVLVKVNSEIYIITRGIFEKIINLCSNVNSQDLLNLENWITKESELGNRTLAVSFKKLNYIPDDMTKEENNLNFAGILSLTDPIKPEIPNAIEKAKKLGIKIIMLTGDSKDVAIAVGKEIGLIDQPNQAILGQDFMNLSIEEQLEKVNYFTIFARVTPEQKSYIINLIEKNKIVGFLGEGVNDALALKAADVGIVVYEGSDIAKEAGDIIILKKNLNVVIETIIQGRVIFANTIKYIRINLVPSFGALYSMLVASFMLDYLPILPMQMLLINLFTDIPMITIVNDAVNYTDLKKPSDYNLQKTVLSAALLGLVSSIFDIIIFVLFKSNTSVLRTNWFISSILISMATIFSLRTTLPFYKAVKPSKSIIALSLIISTITIILPYTHVGQFAFKFVKPELTNLKIIFMLTIFYFIILELIKKFVFNYKVNIVK